MASRKKASRSKASDQSRLRSAGKAVKPPKKKSPGQQELRALETSRKRLRLIAGFSGKIVGDQPFRHQARELAEQARLAFGADACVIRLLEGHDLVLLSAVGVPIKSKHKRIPVGWGLAKKIMDLRRPMFVRDVADHPEISAARNRLPNSYQFTSYAGTPLLVKDRVIGIFGLYKVERMEQFTEDDLDLLQVFGNNMSATILNQQLFEEVTQQRDQLEAEIKERRRAEQALRESEERYRRVVEDLSEFVVRWLPDGTRTFVNESYCRYLGQPAEHLVGTSFLALLDEQDRLQFLRRITRTTPATEIHTAEYHMHLPDGRVAWHEWSDRALFDERGKLREFQSIGHDISERKRLQEQLMQALKMESIGTLAGGIAHDFGNVLAVILGNVSVLQRQPALSPKARELLDDIATAAERGSAFTRQLLTYAHGITRQAAALDLNQLVESVFKMLDGVKPNGIEFNLSLGKSLPHTLADGVQIEQVIMNVGLNALEASAPPARIEISTGAQKLRGSETTTLDLPPGTYLFVRVADQGSGIREAVRARIFEPFFTTKPMGRGMGLATTRAIIEDHKGRIQLESEPGRGTTMTIWLPAMASP